MTRTLIVDDERLARAELRRLLRVHPEIDIVGEASSASEASKLIDTLRPDLLLLDIQMPGGTGFDLLSTLDWVPATIFTTAYDQYAVQAFEFNVLDYLLKPVEPAKLARALNRISSVDRVTKPANNPARLFIEDGERCWFAQISQINLFESEGNYTRVYFNGNTPLVLRSLNQFEATLDKAQFMRASRKHIVNLSYIAKIESLDGGGLLVHMQNGQQLQVSRRRSIAWKALNAT